MGDLIAFIESLGGLHDARVSGLTWQAPSHQLELSIDDLYSNFEGLPEYEGPVRASMHFSEVRKLDVQVDLMESGLMIYDWEMERIEPSTYKVVILFSPGGRMTIECGDVTCVRAGD